MQSKAGVEKEYYLDQPQAEKDSHVPLELQIQRSNSSGNERAIWLLAVLYNFLYVVAAGDA
jgi:hypothetical protein